MTDQYVEYEDFVINSFQDNERKPFWHVWPKTLAFDLEIPKSNRGHLLVITNQYVKYEDFVRNSF
jgi:hypothetical protein